MLSNQILNEQCSQIVFFLLVNNSLSIFHVSFYLKKVNLTIDWLIILICKTRNFLYFFILFYLSTKITPEIYFYLLLDLTINECILWPFHSTWQLDYHTNTHSPLLWLVLYGVFTCFCFCLCTFYYAGKLNQLLFLKTIYLVFFLRLFWCNKK